MPGLSSTAGWPPQLEEIGSSAKKKTQSGKSSVAVGTPSLSTAIRAANAKLEVTASSAPCMHDAQICVRLFQIRRYGAND
jgi:hypothetical protein